MEKSSNGIVDIENGVSETAIVASGAMGTEIAIRLRAERVFLQKAESWLCSQE